MPENCTHDCSTCGESCSERDLRVPANGPVHAVKKVHAPWSAAMGGVGKSTVTSSLAVAMVRRAGRCRAGRRHHRPLHPHGFRSPPAGPPAPTRASTPPSPPSGIKLMSLNLLTANETDPVVWRGPVIANVVKQFWSDVVWGEVDYMFVDMPPGTGDVPLTVFQSLPVDGIIVVTSPQDLVSMIVSKAVHMAEMMSIPVLGLIENYSWYQCPDCGARHAIFGESRLEEVARELGLPILARLPIDPALAAACDAGKVEGAERNYLEEVAAQLDR